MKTRLFLASLFLHICLCALPATSWAQTGGRRSQKQWYTVQNNVIVQRSGSTSKVLKDVVALPNGSRLEPLTRYVVLPTGERELLYQDDVVMASGEIVRIKPVETSRGEEAEETSSSKFTRLHAAPVNGRLKGVVELGASGFNSFIVRIDPQRNWKLEKAEYANSLIMENMATDNDINRGLKAYIGQMLDYGVSGRDIHFVVSSGAAEANVSNHLIANLKALGYVVHVVTPAQEGALGLRAALPHSYSDKAFLVDMGSANTKVGWLDHGVPAVVNSYGSKYYQQAVNDSTVAADIMAKASQVPASRRQTCFIIGGVPYELAKAARQGQESFTVLRPADGYPLLEGAKVKAGLNIYQAIAVATGCQEFVFDWDANFTIGYLLALP